MIDRTVSLQATNTLEIRLTSAPGSFIVISVLDTSAGTQPTALTPNPLALTVGTTANLTATLAPAPTAAGSVTVMSSSPAVVMVPASVPFSTGQTSLAIPATGIAAGSATVTVSLNGASVASQVDVALPVPAVTDFTPTSGQPGTSVTITGANFVNVQTVMFNGVLAPIFTVTNATTLVAVVPPTGMTGPIAVMTLAGTGTSAGSFTVIPAPTVASLQPATLSIVRGTTGALTVTLSAVQTSATSVILASSNTAVATVPGSVSVPANQLSALVTVTTVAVGQADITASLNGASASSTISVVNPVPSITSLSPASLPSGSPNQTLTVTGQSFVNGATVTFGTTALVTTVISATQLTATIHAALLTAKGAVPVTVENPAPGGGTSNSLPFTIVNGAPVLAPIGNKTIPLGSTLTFTAAATDPDNDPVHFAMTPPPLPEHATFHAQTGVFLFTPDATQVGSFPLTVIASDGILTVSETITVTVTGALPGGVTGVSGRVVDGSGQPIANLPVSVKGTTASTTTTAQGQFTLNNLTVTGRQVLLANGFTLGYAILAAPVDLIANVMNTLSSELRVPVIDMASAVTVNPNATTVLGNPAFPAVSVTIPPHTAKNPDGTDFTGALTISPVPEYGRPESRPVELKPGFSITIQPAGIVLDPPAPITLPNTDNLAPGNELDLWSLYPDTGTFLSVGRMRVSADGTKLETIPGTGGVRKTAWHFALAPNPSSTPPEDPDFDDCPECQGVGSGGRLSDGALTHDITIPGVRTQGVARDLTLHYRSTSADVQPILPVNVFLSVRAAVPQTFSGALKIGGTEVAGGLYWNSAALPESNDSTSRIGMQFNGAQLQTGEHPVDLTISSNYPQSSIGGTTRQRILVRNEQNNSIGAGWTLTGVDRLIPQSSGNLVLAGGDGRTALYPQRNRPLVIAGFNEARSLTNGGVNYSFITGAAHNQPRADILNLNNFGPNGIVRRQVTLRPGLSEVTLQALSGVDIFVLNLGSDLSLSEVAVVEQFVREGGALMVMRNAAPFQQPYLNVLGGAFTNDTVISLTPAGLASPLAQGPFGTVTGPITMGANGALAVTGPFTVLSNNSKGANLIMLQQGPAYGGLGRAVISGDEDIFTSNCVVSCSNLYPLFPNNRTLWLNAITFLAGASGFRTSQPLSTGVDTYDVPPGDFSTLSKNADGTYTRTMKDGTVYQFNAQGYQTNKRDRNGNQTTYAYNGNNQLTTIMDPVGQVTTLSYSGNWLQSVTDGAGRTTTLSHDGTGNLTGITHADGAHETFNYDVNHRLVERIDAQTKRYRYQYDYAKRFSTSTKPTGETVSMVPSQRMAVPDVANGQGTVASPAALSTNIVNSASYTDGRNHTTRFELDSQRRVTKQIDPLSRTTTITRDSQGNPLVITRPNGAVTTMTYDAKGNLLTSTESSIAATTTFVYEPTFNQVTRITDPKGNQTNITYDAKGNPLTITDADNKVTRFFYNAQGLLTETRDALYPANPATTFTYDVLGRLLTTTDPLNRTTTLTYDAAGNVATSTDALNRVTSFQYDQKNRLKQVTDPLTGVTQYTYDGNGNLLTVKDAKNQTTTFAYDSRNRLLSTTDPLGKVEAYSYDGNDNLLTRVTPKAETISFAYDAVNQLLSKTLPGSQLTNYQYDLVGNLTNVTDPDSVLAMTYDQANRLTTVKTDGSSNQPAVTLGYAYDQNGNRTFQTDGSARQNLTYDRLNRLTMLTSPLLAACPAPGAAPVSYWPAEESATDVLGGHSGTFVNGATAAAVGRIGHAFQLDGVDDYVRVPHHSALDPTGSFTIMAWIKTTATDVPGRNIAIKYECGQLCPSTATAAYSLHVGSGQVGGYIRESGAASGVVGQSLTGIRLVADGQFHHVAFVRDLAARELRLYVDGQLDATAGLSNDADGPLTDGDGEADPLLIGANFIGGTSTPTSFFAGEIDELKLYMRVVTPGELQVEVGCRPGDVLYAYDALSRRTSLTLPNGTQTTYTYDPASQVTAISHQLTALSSQINKAEYGYNAVGNRTSLTDRRGSQGFGYDQLDRLTSASHPLLGTPQAFAYDPVGNRTTGGSVVNAGNQLTADANHSYQYDDSGNLTRKTLLATGNYSQYTYDAENRLTKVEDFAAGNPTPAFTSTYRYDGLGRRIEKVANGQTKRYIYDGEDILLEYDGANVLQARYTHGPGIDEPIAVTKGGSTFFYHQDGLGTVTDLTDSTGATAKSYSYDAYGTIVDQTGTVEQPYTYTGREFDSESGLYYYRNRYFDSQTGRFLTRDPLGISRGPNVYAYVDGNPVSNIDPTGLGPISFYACTVLNAAKQAYDFRRDLYLLEESTRLTRDMLAKVDSEISACPSKDIKRLQELLNIRAPLELQLDLLIKDFTLDATRSALFQVAEGLVWEGVCALAGVLPIP